jgi:hypothetical protein
VAGIVCSALAWAGGARGGPRAEEKQMEVGMANEATVTALAVTISREGNELAWQVENVGRADVWAYLLVPSVADGGLTFAADWAWLEAEGESLLVRKVDTPSAGRGIGIDDEVRSGAVRLAPAERKRGHLRLGDEVELRDPYKGTGARVSVKRVILEVGWLPWRQEGQPEILEWEGQPFAYISSGNEPGGQRFTRSAPLEWTKANGS